MLLLLMMVEEDARQQRIASHLHFFSLVPICRHRWCRALIRIAHVKHSSTLHYFQRRHIQ